jgi:hypothetical protein
MKKLTRWERFKLALLVYKNANRLKFDPVIAIEYNLEGILPSKANDVLIGVHLIGFDFNGKTTKKSISI